jgi:hypothetical protein
MEYEFVFSWMNWFIVENPIEDASVVPAAWRT